MPPRLLRHAGVGQKNTGALTRPQKINTNDQITKLTLPRLATRHAANRNEVVAVAVAAVDVTNVAIEIEGVVGIT